MNGLQNLRFFLISALLLFPVRAEEIRVATFNILLGLEEPGSVSYERVKSILNRIDSDVVALQEVFNGDRSGNPSDLESLTSELNYPYLFVPEGALDPQSRVILMSRYPFTVTDSIVSPSGANDVTRAAAAVVVDVPGTENDPVIVTAHLKCCLDLDDPFRRAVEMRRIRDYLTTEGYSSDDNIFVLGDFNLIGSNVSFNSLPSGLPASYVLGSDLENDFPFAYSPDPTFYFTDLGLINPDPRQQNGSSSATHNSGSVLDYLLISSALSERGVQTEIYNSNLDASFPGLMKNGSALPSSTSSQASDHFAVFGDFQLDGGELLNVEISSATLNEGDMAAIVTVSVPSPTAQDIMVSLASSDSGEAMLSSQSVTINTGQTSATTTLTPIRDRILDGDQSVTISATTNGFSGSDALITIIDVDTAMYSLTAPGVPVLEIFDGFEGTQDPAGWTVSNSDWRGFDDGSAAIRGPRSYGGGSLGIVTGETVTFDALFKNDSGDTLEALVISYDAQQWRAFENGSADGLSVSLIIDGNETLLPALNFLADTTLPTGIVSPPTSTQKSAQISGLSIPASQSFILRFSAISGTPGGNSDSSEVFINEFHYDNANVDQGEFVEVVVGPDFQGELSNVELVLYNGNGGGSYGTTRTLDNFMPGQTDPLGYQFRYLEFSGIQNGGPDGMALIVDGNVTQFISYEGTFSASNGVASGMTSVDIGVSQSSATPVGEQSLGLTGNGTSAADFMWSVLQGSHSPGLINAGQEFGATSQPQGIAIDNLSVVIPTHGPILPELTLSLVDENNVNIAIPTITGQIYQLESSDKLRIWDIEGLRTGDGSIWSQNLSLANSRFYRVRVSFP